eukprot:gene29119-46319_t
MGGPGKHKQGNQTDIERVSGIGKGKPARWREKRFDLPVQKQSEVLRMALTLKLNKERLIILDDLQFPVPSVELVRDWAHAWGRVVRWRTHHPDGAGWC